EDLWTGEQRPASQWLRQQCIACERWQSGLRLFQERHVCGTGVRWQSALANQPRGAFRTGHTLLGPWNVAGRDGEICCDDADASGGIMAGGVRQNNRRTEMESAAQLRNAG